MQSKIETISKAALLEVQNALSALVGSDISLSLRSAQLQKKDSFLEQQQGRHTLIGLELRGSYNGDGCLALSTGGAIRLCGRMLMLPSADINQVLAEGDFEEETAFAFEDIVRAIIAAYIKTFNGPGGTISSIIYKNKQTVLGALKPAELDYLRDNQAYYQISADMSLDGLNIGTFSMLLPVFVLLYSSIFKNDREGFADPADHKAADKKAAAVSRYVSSRLEFATLQQNNSRFDTLAAQSMIHASAELSRLLGVTVSIDSANQGFVDGENVHRSLQKNAHLSARLSLAGPLEEDIMIVAEPEHGAWLGALLAEGVHGAVLARLQDGSLDADRQDGFAEICEVLMGFLIDAVGSESKTDIAVIQKRIFVYQTGEDESFSSQRTTVRNLYTTLLRLSAGALGIAELHLLFPGGLVDLLPSSEDNQADQADTAVDTDHVEAFEVHQGATVNQGNQGDRFEKDVLIIGGVGGDGTMIQSQLGKDRVSSDIIASTADISRTMLESYSAVILAVEGLNETALGLAIKIHAASSIPLIVAASKWTQSEVLKAIRYGVSDILMTPTRPGEVVEKLEKLAGKAASKDG